MADVWEQAAKQFKSGASAHAPDSSGDDDWKIWEDGSAPSLMPGAKGSGPTGRFLSNFVDAINPIPGIKQMAEESVGPGKNLGTTIQKHIFEPQAEQFKKANAAIHGVGEFHGMSPMSRASSAIGYGMAGALPLVGPAAARAGEQIGEGDVAGGLGSGAGLLASIKASPPIARGVGKGLMRTAEPMAESALGIRNIDRAPGMPSKTPGRAALDLTRGIRPATVSRSAGTAIGDLVNKRDAIIAQSGANISLDPAIAEIDAAIGRAQAGNSDAAHLQAMRRQLTEARPGFQGQTTPGMPPGMPDRVTPQQLAPDFLSMRQRFGEDFTKFDHARPLADESLRVGNKAYGKLTNELHSDVPGSAPLDKTISNLIPVRESAKARDLNAGIGQRMLNRFAVHTGALTAGGLGYHEFGPLGGIAGVVVPELIASPTAQMAGARALNAAGRAVRSPYFTRPLQAAPSVPYRITPEMLVQLQEQQNPPQFARGGIPQRIVPQMLAGRR